MSKVIAIPEEVYERLQRQSEQRGLTIVETIAELTREAEDERLALTKSRLQAQGILLVRAKQRTRARFEPIQVQGPPLSETILEERR